jgi:exopolysaccharide biosynthesis predicted pyruvyltransferase EpsI
MSDLHNLRFQVDDFLREFSGRSVLYHPNPGNGGDSLIAAGTYEAFRRCGINYRAITLDDDVSGQVVFLSGGGNFVRLYINIRDAILRFRDTASKIVILPHTIRDNSDIIPSLDKKFIMFCRDPESYQHVLSLNIKADVFLAHDMAFHLDGMDVLDSRAMIEIAQPRFQQKLSEYNISEHAIREWETAKFWRTDWESRNQSPSSSADISDIFAFGVWPENAWSAAWCMLKAVSLAQKVATDRLHVGVACALLNKECDLRDNSYGKNLSVYRHSFRWRFPKITFSGDRPT